MKLTISLRSFIYYKYLTNINFFPYFLFRCIISTLQPRLTLNLSGKRFSFNNKIFNLPHVWIISQLVSTINRVSFPIFIRSKRYSTRRREFQDGWSTQLDRTRCVSGNPGEDSINSTIENGLLLFRTGCEQMYHGGRLEKLHFVFNN